MAAEKDLVSFVGEALSRGIPRDRIEGALLAAGWTAAQVKDALQAYAAVDFPVPVPRPRPYLSAREAFIYLVLFTTLYLSAWHLGAVAFHFINYGLPDPAMGQIPRRPLFESMRWSISALIIAFPVFLYVTRYVHRTTRADPTRRGSRVRKWLTYVTLYVAAAVLIGDLTALVYNFLGGELTLRIALKVLVVAIIAGSVFGYYLWDLRIEERAAEA
jgi:hypothetical protein